MQNSRIEPGRQRAVRHKRVRAMARSPVASSHELVRPGSALAALAKSGKQLEDGLAPEVELRIWRRSGHERVVALKGVNQQLRRPTGRDLLCNCHGHPGAWRRQSPNARWLSHKGFCPGGPVGFGVCLRTSLIAIVSRRF